RPVGRHRGALGFAPAAGRLPAGVGAEGANRACRQPVIRASNRKGQERMTMLLGKLILITGVASGIGARTAELAGQLGADVIGVDMREPATLSGAFVKADISTKAAVEKLVAKLPDRFDALCNVAGLSGKSGAAPTLAVNFYGLRALSEAMAPKIREGGAIVNVASIAG